MQIIYNITVDDDTAGVFRAFNSEIHNFLRTRNQDMFPCWSSGIFVTKSKLGVSSTGFYTFLKAFYPGVADSYKELPFDKGLMTKLIKEVKRNLGIKEMGVRE